MFLFGRAGAYRRLLGNPHNQDSRVVLADMAKFCRAHETTAAVDRNGKFDELAAARLDGRREVWLRVQRHLNLDNETLWRLYGGQPQIQQQTGE
jgi:hypothetical protein